MKTTIIVEGMQCGHCVSTVKKTIEGMAGVGHVEVSLKDKTAIVEHQNVLVLSELIDELEERGYPAMVEDTSL
ncbi:MAG: heavy-metal-associated domain-containing protein [Bacilli bacterium]|nr:heavy-metal-associated domain-containing protein [Bacilli bacterium]MBN2696763.1 heavy-metal-associated domain-containing protein [Bacilli bacterium]